MSVVRRATLGAICLVLLVGCTNKRDVDPDGAVKTPRPTPPASTSLPPVASPTRPLVPTTAASPSAGPATCATARPAPTGRSESTIKVAGGPARRYILFLPEEYDGRRRLPLVFSFHGYGAGSDQQLLYSGLTSVAERNGFVLVALDGQGDPRHYNQRSVARGGEVSDITVVNTVLDALSDSLCLDSKRVYATGMSDGGALAAALGCFASKRFAAVAPVAALVYDPACAEATPVALMAFRGTADKIVPYAGGRVACCGNPVVEATETDIASWADHNGCDPKPTVTQHGAVKTSAYTGCDGPGDVVLHSVIGGGHTWPGAFGLPGLGVTTRDIVASEAIWEFFAAHPKP
ncbi:MAG: PHB depolymerase family esterase [Mycobacteriales bacterium]